jgi:hypothetical protein
MPKDDPSTEEPPPILGSWRRLYAAVLLLELGVVSLIALFSRWPY